jgi:hypothetical protein
MIGANSLSRALSYIYYEFNLKHFGDLITGLLKLQGGKSESPILQALVKGV